jgi:hypothetical protein
MKYSLPGVTSTDDALITYNNSESGRYFFNSSRDREFMELIEEQEKYPPNQSEYFKLGTFIEAFISLCCKENLILPFCDHRHICMYI